MDHCLPRTGLNCAGPSEKDFLFRFVCSKYSWPCFPVDFASGNSLRGMETVFSHSQPQIPYHDSQPSLNIRSTSFYPPLVESADAKIQLQLTFGGIKVT